MPSHREQTADVDEPPFWLWLTSFAAALVLLWILLLTIERYYSQ